MALGAGPALSRNAVTMAEMCGPSMFSIMAAARAIQAGDAQVVVAGGTENMTEAPYLPPKARGGQRPGHGRLIDSMIRDGLSDAYGNEHMDECAEMCAKKYKFTRQRQDEYPVAMAAMEELQLPHDPVNVLGDAIALGTRSE